MSSYWLDFDFWNGIGRGSEFSVFRINNGRISIAGERIEIIRQNSNTYYLIEFRQGDNTPLLVTNRSNLQKIGFTHSVNMVGNHRNQLSAIGVRANNLERQYYEALRRYMITDTRAEFLRTYIGGILAAKKVAGHDLSALPSLFSSTSNFSRSQVLKPAATQHTIFLVPTQQLLRSASSSALSNLNSTVNRADNNLTEGNGRVLDYQTARDVESTAYWEIVHQEFFALDLKYLHFNNRHNNLIGHTLHTFLQLFDGIAPMFLAEGVTEVTTYIATALHSASNATHISTTSPPIRDPDLRRMFNNIDRAGNNFMRHVYNPRHIDQWGNLDLFSSASFQRSAHQNTLDQTIAILGQLDITIYNQAGDLIGKIVGGVAEYDPYFDAENPLIIMTEDELSVLIFPYENNYRIEITTTDIGIMHYLEFRVDERGSSISETSVNGIFVESEQVFVVNAPENNSVDYTRLFADNEAFSVVINATAADNNGVVIDGNSGHIRGDKVILFAVPDERFLFDGWYENDIRVHTEEFYVFIAKMDRTLEARFSPDSASPDITTPMISAGHSHTIA